MTTTAPFTAPGRDRRSYFSTGMALIWAIALADLLFHIYFNNRYGYFRYEFASSNSLSMFSMSAHQRAILTRWKGGLTFSSVADRNSARSRKFGDSSRNGASPLSRAPDFAVFVSELAVAALHSFWYRCDANMRARNSQGK